MTTVPSTTAFATSHGGLASEQPLPALLAERDLDRLRRYREYLQYYEGTRGAPPRQGRERALSFNYARAIVEKGASYLVTDHHPAVTPTEGAGAARAAEAERALLDAWEANDLARLDLETRSTRRSSATAHSR